ncbi:MAG: hypothetical protein WBB42_12300 [Polyangiales bacterium]
MTKRNLLMICFAAAAVAACGGTESNPGPRQNPLTCPMEAPDPGATCTGDDRCEYGEETCCGETHPAFVCGCQGGQFACFFTDACLGAPLQCPEQFPCSDEECGPAPGAPNVLCWDDSIGGPVCERNDEGICGWSFRSCPPNPCDTFECDPGSSCVLEDVVCVRAPCLPQPVCMPDVIR